MSKLQISLITWAVIILLVSYMFGINPVSIVTDIAHAAQTVHNSHPHP